MWNNINNRHRWLGDQPPSIGTRNGSKRTPRKECPVDDWWWGSSPIGHQSLPIEQCHKSKKHKQKHCLTSLIWKFLIYLQTYSPKNTGDSPMLGDAICHSPLHSMDASARSRLEMYWVHIDRLLAGRLSCLFPFASRCHGALRVYFCRSMSKRSLYSDTSERHVK